MVISFYSKLRRFNIHTFLLSFVLFIGYDRKEKLSCSINPLMDKWEMSLMDSLNFSQLFLHLITLGMQNEF